MRRVPQRHLLRNFDNLFKAEFNTKKNNSIHSIFSNVFCSLAMVARGCISLAVALTFMLQFYVPMEISWNYMHSYFSPKLHNIVQIVWRLFAVMFITAIAIIVPDLGTIIDIVGAVFLATLGLFVPAVMDLVINWENGLGAFKWRMYKNILVMFISIFASISGLYFSLTTLFGGK